MSQFCSMTTRERQLQAAAICREVQGPGGDAEMDLGRKVSTPKDIMLEELSLTSNRGSRLFKMRQRRSEKYTFESIQNNTNTQITNGVTLQAESEESTENHDGKEDDQAADETNAPEPITVADPDSIAPGYGGHLKDVPPEKFNSTAIPKSYQSPWGQAIDSDPALADTLLPRMPDPETQPEAPRYKSFNRVATPFGGYTPRPVPQAPETAPGPEAALPDYPELREDSAAQRPTFNRTALGWVTVSPPLLLSTVTLDPTFIPESDDL